MVVGVNVCVFLDSRFLHFFLHGCEIKSGSGWEVGTRYGHFKSKMY